MQRFRGILLALGLISASFAAIPSASSVQTEWSLSASPGTWTSPNDSGAAPLEYVKIKATQAGWITAIKVWMEAGPWHANGKVQGILRQDDPSLTLMDYVQWTAATAPVSAGWQTLSLATPIQIAQDQVFWLGHYVYYTAGYWKGTYAAVPGSPLQVLGSQALQDANPNPPNRNVYLDSATPTDAWVDLVFTTVRPATVPGAPTAATAIAGDLQATVSFSPPSDDGGATITSYTVQSTPSGFTATGSSSPITVTGLSNGINYTFKVKATNSVGGSAWSSNSTAVIPKLAQGITFADPGAQRLGTSQTLTATSSSALAVSFTSSTPGVCTVTTAGELTMLAVGTCTIAADQVGDASYLAASTVTRSFEVASASEAAPAVGSSHSLTYVATGGACAIDRTAQTPAGAWVTLPSAADCTRSGYVLTGWSVGAAAPHSDLVLRPGRHAQVTGDNRLFAVWTPLAGADQGAGVPTSAPALTVYPTVVKCVNKKSGKSKRFTTAKCPAGWKKR